ncbi:DNA polymerase II [Candidatus Bathyarchaeota archaeon]|nr:DNA polymerase II [Candidatus Bathyarchaeota archaeon]
MLKKGRGTLETCKFWLLDINYEVKDHKPEVWLWGIDENGRRVLVIDKSFQPYFYAVLKDSEDPRKLYERIINAKENLPFITGIELVDKRFFGKPVKAARICCQDPDLIAQYAKAIRKIEGVEECLETDIRYSMRYLIDNELSPCAWHEVKVEEEPNTRGLQVDKIYSARSRPKRIEKEKIPHLRVLSFFPICYASQGSPKPERDPVVVIAVATNEGEKKIFMAEEYDDKRLMKSFIGYIKAFDPDIIVGYQTNQEYWQYLTDRAATLGINFLIDRAGTQPHRSVYGHVSITGRASMDMFDFADELPELKVKSLENMAAILGVKDLKEQKIIHELEYSDYWDDEGKRKELLMFASEKAECLLGIFDKLFMYASELSKLVGIPLDHIGKAAVGFRIEWYLIREAYKIGELVPERLEQRYLPYAGGMVLKPKPGVHEEVCVLDFKSMYPNIMIEKNISPDTYIPPSTKTDVEVNITPEVGHRFRKSPPGFYKVVLTKLISVREEIRKAMKKVNPGSIDYRLLDARQKAVKVITNAAYGYAGWVGARWFRKPVAEATAAWGRSMIMKSVNMAKELGLEIIYGDTDSLFIKYEPEKVEALVKRIQKELGLEIRPEKIYKRILFTEAKKRYCGLLPDGSLDNVGLEVVRGDWANVAKMTQEHVLELILKENSVSKAVEFVRSLIGDLRKHRIPYRDLVIWKTLTRPVEKYKVNAPHVEAAKVLKRMGWSLTAGDQVGYVIIRGSGRLYERAKPYVLASYEDVDVEYYIKNQIVPAALRILSMFGVKEKDLISAEVRRPKTLADFFSPST